MSITSANILDNFWNGSDFQHMEDWDGVSKKSGKKGWAPRRILADSLNLRKLEYHGKLGFVSSTNVGGKVVSLSWLWRQSIIILTW